MKIRPQGLAPRDVNAAWAPVKDRSIPLMPAHACSLVWRGSLLVVFGVSWILFGIGLVHGEYSCDFLMYFAPPRLRMQQWFERRFDQIVFCETIPQYRALVKGNRRSWEKLCLTIWSGYLVLGLASGLEAFSREPPCDSIGALAFRQTPETSGKAWEFLSYYPILPSRYLRDPFNTLVFMFSR